MNVATYGPGGRFAMTDRGQTALRQSAREFTVGPSKMRWTQGSLFIEIDEWGAPPYFGRIRGQVTVTPSAVTPYELALTEDGAHLWRPFAPIADIDVELDAPGWKWKGHGYMDANFGTRALEADFDHWSWGRYPTEGGATVHYDARRRDGSSLGVSISFGQCGDADVSAPLPVARLPRSLWAVRRRTRADPGYVPCQVMSMLDAPFYARALVRNRIEGYETFGVHEALDLRRFRSPLLMPVLACRVPRRRGWKFEGG